MKRIFIEASTDLQKDNLNIIAKNINNFELVESYAFITNYTAKSRINIL